MSIKYMTLVWEHSRYKGARLLLMLAVADFARDPDGRAWPSTPTLARKIRMSHRYTKKMLEEILSDRQPELRRLRQGGAGPGDTSLLQIVINIREGGQSSTENKGEAGLMDEAGLPLEKRGRRAPEGGGGPPLRGRRASAKGEAGLPRTVINPHEPSIEATATAAAAAAEHDEWWLLPVLLSSGKVHRKRVDELLSQEPAPAPGAFVSYYLYATTAPRIDNPALWAAKQVADNPGQFAGEPFESLAGAGPAGLAAACLWLADPTRGLPDVNGAMPALLAWKGQLDAKHKGRALDAIAERTINELGLSRLVTGIVQAEIAQRAALPAEPEPPPAPVRPADAWDGVLRALANEVPGPAMDRLRRCRLLSESDRGLTVAVPTEHELAWLVNRLGRTLADRFNVTLTAA